MQPFFPSKAEIAELNNFQRFFLTLQRSADTKWVHFSKARRFAGRRRSRGTQKPRRPPTMGRGGRFSEKSGGQAPSGGGRSGKQSEKQRTGRRLSQSPCAPALTPTPQLARGSHCPLRGAPDRPAGGQAKKTAASPPSAASGLRRSRRAAHIGNAGETGGARARCALHEVKRTNKRRGKAAPQPCCAESAARRAPAQPPLSQTSPKSGICTVPETRRFARREISGAIKSRRHSNKKARFRSL